jgi:hypothetical protein
MTTPKVFVSHASEDKERFVLDFARRLPENGVDSLNSYDTSLQRILAAIFDANDKPSIGRPPSRFTGS